MCVCVCVYIYIYIYIVYSMLLTRPYAWLAHTRMCFSRVIHQCSPSSQKRMALECVGVCVCPVSAKVSSQALRHCSCLNGYIKPLNEQSGHKQDKYRNHEHTQFGCTYMKQQPDSCTFTVPERSTCCVQFSTRWGDCHCLLTRQRSVFC